MMTIKTLGAFSTFFLFMAVSFAQKEDIDVFEKKDGNKVIVMARNTGKVDYSVTIDITSTGMDVSPSNKVEKVIQPGTMKEMAYLQPKPGEAWEYSYDISFIKASGKMTSSATTPSTEQPQTTPADKLPVPPPLPSHPAPVLSKADIVVYTKPGCSRCEFVKKQLKADGVPFEEYSTASDSPEINHMWAGLRNSGFSGGSVTMPVVRLKGKYYYDIPDLNGFVTKLKKS